MEVELALDNDVSGLTARHQALLSNLTALDFGDGSGESGEDEDPATRPASGSAQGGAWRSGAGNVDHGDVKVTAGESTGRFSGLELTQAPQSRLQRQESKGRSKGDEESKEERGDVRLAGPRLGDQGVKQLEAEKRPGLQPVSGTERGTPPLALLQLQQKKRPSFSTPRARSSNASKGGSDGGDHGTAPLLMLTRSAQKRIQRRQDTAGAIDAEPFSSPPPLPPPSPPSEATQHARNAGADVFTSDDDADDDSGSDVEML